MTVYRTDPLRDARWAEFLRRHTHASVFHTPGWLEALRRTYGYEPIVLTTCPPGAEFTNGLAFCRVHSWLTGRRMVSLPFSDHCEPLVDSMERLGCLLDSLQRDAAKENWKYIEVRPLSCHVNGSEAGTGFQPVKTFWRHKLDLHPDLDELFSNFHKDSVRRAIRHAERLALTYEEGTSESLLRKFYHLLLLTRRRHRLPPQPLDWFRNLVDCLGDGIQIRVVSKDGQPAASIITLHYKNSVVYKYGCWDTKFRSLRGTALLFWKTIQEAKNNGADEFDLGRSDCDQPGLIAFKDHWGTVRSTMTYWRYPAGPSESPGESWKMQIARKLFAGLPDAFLATAGKFLYRHVG